MIVERNHVDQFPADAPNTEIDAVDEEERQTPRRLVGNQLEPARLNALMEQLQKEVGRTRAAVPMSQDGPETVLARLVHDARRRKRAPIILLGVFLAEFAALIGLYLICALRGIKMTGIDVIMCIFLCVGLFFFCTVARAIFMPRSRRWRRIKSGDVVAKYDDIRVIGHLAEALTNHSREVAAQAELELTVLLPRLCHGNADLLSSDQRQCIYRSMLVRNITSKPQLLIESLGAVERISDTRALPEVIALASQVINTPDGRAVKAAAESCLQVLRQSESEKDARRSLLRATSADAVSGDELLRSAEHVDADNNPAELLRALPND